MYASKLIDRIRLEVNSSKTRQQFWKVIELIAADLSDLEFVNAAKKLSKYTRDLRPLLKIFLTDPRADEKYRLHILKKFPKSRRTRDIKDTYELLGLPLRDYFENNHVTHSRLIRQSLKTRNPHEQFRQFFSRFVLSEWDEIITYNLPLSFSLEESCYLASRVLDNFSANAKLKQLYIDANN